MRHAAPEQLCATLPLSSVCCLRPRLTERRASSRAMPSSLICSSTSACVASCMHRAPTRALSHGHAHLRPTRPADLLRPRHFGTVLACHGAAPSAKTTRLGAWCAAVALDRGRPRPTLCETPAEVPRRCRASRAACAHPWHLWERRRSGGVARPPRLRPARMSGAACYQRAPARSAIVCGSSLCRACGVSPCACPCACASPFPSCACRHPSCLSRPRASVGGLSGRRPQEYGACPRSKRQKSPLYFSSLRGSGVLASHKSLQSFDID